MKRFKLIFHITYVVIALFVMYFSIDVLVNTEEYLSRIKLSSYIKFPRYIMVGFLIISLLMVVEFVLERIHIHRVKEGMSEMEDEILLLKAKLYDKSQDPPESEEDLFDQIEESVEESEVEAPEEDEDDQN